VSVTSTSWQARLRQCLLLGSQRRRSSCCTACSSRSARAGTASVRRGWSRSRSGSCGSPGSRAGSSALRRGPLCTPGRRRRRSQTTCSVRLGACRVAAAATHRAACEVLTSIGNAGLLEDEPHKVFDTVNITVKCVLPTRAQRCTVHWQQAGRVRERVTPRQPFQSAPHACAVQGRQRRPRGGGGQGRGPDGPELQVPRAQQHAQADLPAGGRAGRRRRGRVRRVRAPPARRLHTPCTSLGPAASVWCRLLCGSPQPRAACRAGLGRVVDASPRADALSGGAESGGPVLRQAGGGPRARQPAAPARAPAAVRQGRRGGQPGDRQRGAPVRARDPPRGAALSRAAAACVAGPCPWRNSKHAAFGTISLAKVAYAYDTVARSGGKAPHAMNHLAEQGLRAIHLWCLPLPNVRHACTREASGARAAQARAEAARDDGAAARAGAARHGRQAAARRRAAGRAAGAGADAGGRARRRGRRGRGRAAEEGRRAGGAGAAAAAAGAPPLRGDRTGPCRARGLVRRCVGCGAGLSWAAPAWLRRMRKGLTRAVRRPWTAGGGAYLLPRQVCCRQMQSPLRPSKR